MKNSPLGNVCISEGEKIHIRHLKHDITFIAFTCRENHLTYLTKSLPRCKARETWCYPQNTVLQELRYGMT